jgi:MscS family membrane protein
MLVGRLPMASVEWEVGMRSIRFLLGAMALALAVLASASRAQEPDQGAAAMLVAPINTESPRDTFESFRELSDAMEAAVAEYLAEPTFEGVAQLALLSDRMNALIDLEPFPAASRRETGIRTAAFLMDIFGRLPAIDPATLPDIAALDEAASSVRIPGTSLYIVRMEDGQRRGEHLFSAATVDAAPRLYRALKGEPLRSSIGIDSFSALGPQLSGPLVPAIVIEEMPDALKQLWFDTPRWKAIAFMALVLASVAAILLLWYALSRAAPGQRLSGLALRALVPLALLLAAEWALPWVAFQINLSGRFADFAAILRSIVSHVSYAWLFWIGVRMVFESMILSPRIHDASLDANLLRLVSGVLGIIGVAIILAMGGQAIGLPILSVFAGLGIGGLAVALALRPTLENLFGGVMLYIDRPVRVGDFCQFGTMKGTVEVIGVRSTKLRALDRTLITVPNAQFADMQIINYAHCDRLLMTETLGLRYETTPDQLRHLLAGLRRMLHAHPRIDDETVRVRFAGYGDFALKVDIRIYAVTREWNDFFAIREDVLLRVHDCVAASGTGFAFPSQTLYLARDGGRDPQRAAAAEAEVAEWRRTHRLPFPRLSAEEIERLRGTLDYPPQGSIDGLTEAPESAAEPLSAPEPSNGEGAADRRR